MSLGLGVFTAQFTPAMLAMVGLMVLDFSAFTGVVGLPFKALVSFLNSSSPVELNGFFVLQFGAYLISLLAFNRGINSLLQKVLTLEAVYLPCWSFGFFAYFLVYFVGRQLAAPVEVVRSIYTLMAFGGAGLAIAGCVWRQWQGKRWWRGIACDWGTLAVVGLFALAMLWVGPYLEFPSDATVYFYRIQAWEKARWMDYAGLSSHHVSFATFSNHWLLQPADADWGGRAGAGLLSAVMQSLLFWEFIRLTRFLTGSRSLSWLAGCLSLGYFGYSAISFYRYVTFAGSMLGQIVYIEALLIIFGIFLQQQWRYLLLIAPLIWLGGNVHPQSALFQLNTLLGVGILLGVCRYRTLSPRFRRGLLELVVVAVALAVVVIVQREVFGQNADSDYANLHVFDLMPKFGINLYFARYIPLSNILGCVGWLTLLGAALVLGYRRPTAKLDVVAAAALWPLLALQNPLALAALNRIMSADVFHRLMYTSFYWVFLVVGLQSLASDWSRWHGRRFKSWGWFPPLQQSFALMVGGGALLLSWVAGDPVYGKMRHVWHRVDPQLDGSDLQPTINYLRTQATQNCEEPLDSLRAHLKPIRRYVFSDPYVSTYLLNTGYFYATAMRFGQGHGYESSSLGFRTELASGLDYAQFRSTLQARNVCYVVLYLPEKEVVSQVGMESGHWFADYAHPQRFYASQLLTWVRESPEDFRLVFEQDGVEVFRVQ